jgi:hypothetical protein
MHIFKKQKNLILKRGPSFCQFHTQIHCFLKQFISNKIFILKVFKITHMFSLHISFLTFTQIQPQRIYESKKMEKLKNISLENNVLLFKQALFSSTFIGTQFQSFKMKISTLNIFQSLLL